MRGVQGVLPKTARDKVFNQNTHEGPERGHSEEKDAETENCEEKNA